MNVPLAFVLIASVGYFARSVLTTYLESKQGPSVLFSKIVAALEEMARTNSWITKPSSRTYLIQPKGHIGGLHYDGRYAAYIQLAEHNTFRVVAHSFDGRAWHQLDNPAQPMTPAQFADHLSDIVGLPISAKQRILSQIGQSLPADYVPRKRGH